MNSLTLLVDASSLLYRAYYSTPASMRAPDGQSVNAAHGFMNMLARLVVDHDPARLALATDQDWRPAWRVDLIPAYKAARVEPGEPQATADSEVARQSVLCFELLAGLGVVVIGHRGYEAEDVIGTLAERSRLAGTTPVGIVSGDRDLFQLVRDPDVFVFYPVKGVTELARIDEAEITRRYGIPGRSYADYAVLRGDPSDGLPGVKGIGDKTASALLARYGSLAEIVRTAGEGAGAGPLSRVAGQLDYVDRAAQVVRIPLDLPLPELDLSRSRAQPRPEVAARADSEGLGGAFGRLAVALCS
ncbi:MAG: 5'-3' exonuclease [Acidimicrobiia bacterium]